MPASLFKKILARFTPAPAKPNSADPRKILGNDAEAFALKLLKSRGHKFVARNVLFKRGELDIITWQGDTLVFTEVRARSREDFGSAAETVNPRKQERVRRAANAYLSRNFSGRQLPNCRFDIVWLVADNGRIVESGVIEGAF